MTLGPKRCSVALRTAGDRRGGDALSFAIAMGRRRGGCSPCVASVPRCGPTPKRFIGRLPGCRRKSARETVGRGMLRTVKCGAHKVVALNNCNNCMVYNFSRAVMGMPNRCSLGVLNGTFRTGTGPGPRTPRRNKDYRPNVIVITCSHGGGNVTSSSR